LYRLSKSVDEIISTDRRIIPK